MILTDRELADVYIDKANYWEAVCNELTGMLAGDCNSAYVETCLRKTFPEKMHDITLCKVCLINEAVRRMKKGVEHGRD